MLHERGIDVSHETIRFWWNQFGPLFAAEIHYDHITQAEQGFDFDFLRAK